MSFPLTFLHPTFPTLEAARAAADEYTATYDGAIVGIWRQDGAGPFAAQFTIDERAPELLEDALGYDPEAHGWTLIEVTDGPRAAAEECGR